jgi:hypothetical protein
MMRERLRDALRRVSELEEAARRGEDISPQTMMAEARDIRSDLVQIWTEWEAASEAAEELHDKLVDDAEDRFVKKSDFQPYKDLAKWVLALAGAVLTAYIIFRVTG